MPAELVVLGITSFFVFLFSVTLHEAAHAFAAWKLGDSTAYHGGQVSLNPIPHAQREPFGMLLVPLISLLLSKGQSLFGWASAPLDPVWTARNHRRSAIVYAAGPASNLLLVLVAGLAIRVGCFLGYFTYPDQITSNHDLVAAVSQGGLADAIAGPLGILFSLNLLLFVFNLIPVPPLDGHGIVPLFLSESAADTYRETMANFSFIGLIVAWKLGSFIYGPAFDLALRFLYPNVTYS